MCIVVSFTSVVSMPVFNILLIALKNTLFYCFVYLQNLQLLYQLNLICRFASTFTTYAADRILFFLPFAPNTFYIQYDKHSDNESFITTPCSLQITRVQFHNVKCMHT